MNYPNPETSLQASNPEVLVKVETVGKIFCRDLKKSLLYGLKDSVRDLVGGKSDTASSDERPLREGEFWANKDISFELRRGECLGLIGGNGAGKTTLLKMLNGLIKPDVGRIEMRGRVGALIALGAGFNPILSGRENIYINGSVLGLSKEEIDEKLDDVIDFSEIREFIDSPVQTYSSGMQVRLGFAIATAMEPDVLILDEVLAVGDANFRSKCFSRISSIMDKAAIIFVSHSEEQLGRICTSGMLLQKGMTVKSGNLKECLETYREISSVFKPSKAHSCDPSVRDVTLSLLSEDHKSGDDFHVNISYSLEQQQELSIHVLGILDSSGAPVAAVDLLALINRIPSGDSNYRINISSLSLKPGNYFLAIEAASSHNAKPLVRTVFPHELRVHGSITHWAFYTPVAEIVEVSEE